MACPGTWPRQPRSGNPTNSARVVSGSYNGKSGWWVQCKNTSSTYVNCMFYTNQDRANSARDKLNNIFGQAGADLDFITSGIGTDNWGTDRYSVIWPTVRWDNTCASSTQLTDANKKTWELLYRGCHLTIQGYLILGDHVVI